MVEQFLWDTAHIDTGSTETPCGACSGGEKKKRELGGGKRARDRRREGRIEGKKMEGRVTEGGSEEDEWMRVNV